MPVVPLGQQPKPGKSTRISAMKTDQRAMWVIDRWDQRPSMMRKTMLLEVQRHFACGKTAAEQALKRAYEIYREEAADMTQDKIVRHLQRLLETAERKGDERGAARILESIARVRGVAAAEKFEDVTPRVENARDLSTAQLDALAALED